MTDRLAFWSLHVLGVLALAQGVQVLLRRLSMRRMGGPWSMIAVAGLLASGLFVPIAIALDRAFPVESGPEAITLQEMAEEWVMLAPAVMLVWLGLNAVRFLRLPHSAATPGRIGAPEAGDASRTVAPPSDQVAPTTPGFLDKLPADRRGPLVALSAELHYLRVHTTRGDALVLYSFGDALDEVAASDGIQIHRSHWVATRFVQTVQRDGTRLSVVMSNGLVLPVARSRRTDVLPRLEQAAAT
jgi:hypothetical protein